MKKVISVGVFFLVSFFGFSQSTVVTISSGHGFNIVPDDAPETVTGSMYLDGAFTPARINEEQDVVILRYNAYKDEMEFQQGQDTYYLIKEDNVKIDFLNNKKTYNYLSYSDGSKQSQKGFLVELVNGKKSLYEKEAVAFIPSKPTTTGYEAPKPAEYKRSKEAFFIKVSDKVVNFPKNKKELLKMFPDNNSQISDYLKKNKVSFSKKEDLIGLTKFLNTL